MSTMFECDLVSDKAKRSFSHYYCSHGGKITLRELECVRRRQPRLLQPRKQKPDNSDRHSCRLIDCPFTHSTIGGKTIPSPSFLHRSCNGPYLNSLCISHGHESVSLLQSGAERCQVKRERSKRTCSANPLLNASLLSPLQSASLALHQPGKVKFRSIYPPLIAMTCRF